MIPVASLDGVRKGTIQTETEMQRNREEMRQRRTNLGSTADKYTHMAFSSGYARDGDK